MMVTGRQLFQYAILLLEKARQNEQQFRLLQEATCDAPVDLQESSASNFQESSPSLAFPESDQGSTSGTEATRLPSTVSPDDDTSTNDAQITCEQDNSSKPMQADGRTDSNCWGATNINVPLDAKRRVSWILRQSVWT